MSDQSAQNDTNSAVHPVAARVMLRRAMIAARQAIPAVAHRAASEHIRAHLADLLLPLPAATIGFCAAIRAEVDCGPLVVRLIAAGWRAAMPVVVAADAPLAFRRWSADAPMTTDPYGIPVPATEAVPAPQVLLLPLVAFDTAGYRLGYGGGYFDRTLAACTPRPRTIGVGFERCVVESIGPEGHDIPLDWIVTESGIRRFKSP